MSIQIGLDLGTANVRISVRGETAIKRAPSVVALRTRTEEILAMGNEAKQMIGRTPHTVAAVRPIKAGVVDNIAHASLLVGALFDHLGATSVFRRPSVTATIPYGAAETEKRALEDAIFEAGAGAVNLIDSPLACAVGAGMRIAGTGGGMIVDIGAGRTEIAIVSHGGVLVSGNLKLAGDAFTDTLIRYLAEEQHILVGENTAEAIKHKIGTLNKRESGSVTVAGKSTKMGGALTATISCGMLREAFVPLADRIAATVRKVMEETPPELAASISDFGILLSGGGSMLDGLPEYLGEKLGVKIVRSRSPIDDGALGILNLMENGELRRYISSRAR